MTLKRKLDHLSCVTAGVWAVIRALTWKSSNSGSGSGCPRKFPDESVIFQSKI